MYIRFRNFFINNKFYETKPKMKNFIGSPLFSKIPYFFSFSKQIIIFI